MARKTQGNNNNIIIIYMRKRSIKTFKTAIETSKLSADLGLVDADINTLHTWQQKPDMSRQAEAKNPLPS